MDPLLRPADVVSRVVAWHNRHPLARRIDRDAVVGVGVVGLPFAVAEGDGPPPPGARLEPLFASDWLYRPATRLLGRWVQRHAVYPVPACAGWPFRQIDADLALSHHADHVGLAGRTLRHLITAVIERDGHRVRVLVAPTGPLRRAAVLGPRLWSGPRAAAAGALATGLLAAVAWPLSGAPDEPHPLQIPTVHAIAPAASAASSQAEAQTLLAADTPSAAPATPAVEAATRAAPEQTPAPADSSHAAASAPTPADPPVDAAIAAPAVAEVTRPIDVPITVLDPHAGHPPLVAIRPRLDDASQRQARVSAAALRQPADGPIAAPAGTVYAIVTTAQRKREDALAQEVLLRGLLAQTATELPTRLDVMPSGRRWRVVWWPLPNRKNAQALLLQVRARGLQAELVDF